MKKKIALLLVGVMALTTTVFGASSTSISAPTTIKTDGNGATLMAADLTTQTLDSSKLFGKLNGGSAGSGANNLNYSMGDQNGYDVTKGSEMTITLPSGMKLGDQINIQLSDNAKWAYNYYAYGDAMYISTNDPAALTAGTTGYTTSDVNQNGVGTNGDISGNVVKVGSQSAQLDINNQLSGENAYSSDVTKLIFAAAISDYVNNSASGVIKPTFSARISNTNDNLLTLTLTSGAPNDGNSTISVPMAVYTGQSSAPVKLSVSNGQKGSAITSQSVIIANPVEGSTTTSISGADTNKAKSTFDIITTENRAGVFTNGSETIKMERAKYSLPTGFSFTNVGSTTLSTTPTPLDISSRPAVSNLNGPVSTIPANVYWDMNSSTNGAMKNTMFVEYDLSSTNGPSTSPATIRLNDVTVAIDASTAKYGDIVMTVDGSASSTSKGNISSQDNMQVGSYTDWAISFQPYSSGAAPTALVSGRLDFNVANSSENAPSETVSDDNIFDKNNGVFMAGNFNNFDADHKTLQMSFAEKTQQSWWSGRDTTFTMPDGVNIIGAKIDQVKNIKKADGSNWQGTNESSNQYNGMQPFDKDDSYITITDNVLTLSNLTTSQSGKASFRIVFWVAADANYSGDITCTVGGPGVNDEKIEPVTIATAVVPYDVSTKVTNAQIGVQSYKVEDITISETEMGRFLSDESLYIALDYKNTAAANGGLIFRDATVQVTDGDLSIKNSTVSNGVIKINFDGSSSKNMPSTIKISDVSISMDRNVPETNAEPFALKISTDNKDQATDNKPDVRSTIRYGDITKPYVNVITKASGATTGSVVSVTAGSNIAIVDGQSQTLDTEPFIDPATSSMMVPVRVVSVGCGVPEENIIWDSVEETVTIITGVNDTQIIQFKVGSTNYMLNGVSIPNENGAVTQIKDDRCFIPMRTLGYALGVPVSWDETTSTATFNGDMQS